MTFSCQQVLMPLAYFPPVDWFVQIARAETILLEQHEHYQKGSYRNRCRIATANGVQTLSVPLRKGKNQQQPIKEVAIAYDEPWQRQHYRTIVAAYGNSPFFEHFIPVFEPFFLEKKYELLWDWNYDLLNVCLNIIKLKTPMVLTRQYVAVPDSVIDLRPPCYSKPSSQTFENESFRYPQVFEDRLGFLPNLSVLDLIFCAGRLNV